MENIWWTRDTGLEWLGSRVLSMESFYTGLPESDGTVTGEDWTMPAYEDR